LHIAIGYHSPISWIALTAWKGRITKNYFSLPVTGRWLELTPESNIDDWLSYCGLPEVHEKVFYPPPPGYRWYYGLVKPCDKREVKGVKFQIVSNTLTPLPPPPPESSETVTFPDRDVKIVRSEDNLQFGGWSMESLRDDVLRFVLLAGPDFDAQGQALTLTDEVELGAEAAATAAQSMVRPLVGG
jgi:hypothetical protein